METVSVIITGDCTSNNGVSHGVMLRAVMEGSAAPSISLFLRDPSRRDSPRIPPEGSVIREHYRELQRPHLRPLPPRQRYAMHLGRQGPEGHPTAHQCFTRRTLRHLPPCQRYARAPCRQVPAVASISRVPICHTGVSRCGTCLSARCNICETPSPPGSGVPPLPMLHTGV